MIVAGAGNHVTILVMMKVKKIILIFGDSLVFWLAFVIMLFSRWSIQLDNAILVAHLIPFVIIYLAVIMIVYAMGLYSAQYLLGKIEWITSAIIGVFLILFASTTIFYFYGRINPAITPRGSLILNWGIFSLLFMLWRIGIEKVILTNLAEKTLIIGSDRSAIQLATILKQAKGIGFEISHILPGTPETYATLADLADQEQVQNVIFLETPNQREAETILTRLMALNINYYDSASLYEQRLQKVYLDSVSHVWILNNIIKRRSPLAIAAHDYLQRLTALILAILLAPLGILILLLILLFQRQLPFYTQKRAGKDNKVFTLYKFRTMNNNAEAAGPQWAAERDPRITPLGRILRASHLDELPQLINIIKGDMAFVGPRPERPEFVADLEKNIPFYQLRHQVKPGVTGWAQINYPYGASISDAKEKLQYDLYYLKQRSILIDLMIIVRTVRLFFQNPARS
jgi:exopolysaccharide biosynthesis polyprenyl glycosylphosphotransferase